MELNTLIDSISYRVKDHDKGALFWNDRPLSMQFLTKLKIFINEIIFGIKDPYKLKLMQNSRPP